MFVRYELDINGVPTGYGAVIGASIFGLVPSDLSTEYVVALNTLPNPVFDDLEGFHAVSYFKVNDNAKRLGEFFKGIIEQGCRNRSFEGFELSLREVRVDELTNIVYEDEFQAVVLVEGTTLFKELEIDKELDSLTVRPKIIFDVLDRVRKKQVDDND